MSDVSDEELERAMANAKAMPKDTKKHREERSAAIETARNRKYSKKAIAKAGGKNAIRVKKIIEINNENFLCPCFNIYTKPSFIAIIAAFVRSSTYNFCKMLCT